MDIQSFLRLRNLFPQPMAQMGLDTSNPDPSANMPGLQSVDNTPPPDVNANLMDAFQPRHDISDQYTQALTSMPQRPQPGALRRIAAGIAGMGAGAGAQGISGGQPIGFKYDPRMADIASDKVKYGDYDNQLNDWMNQTKALGLGANEEDRANIGEAKRVAGNADREIKQQLADTKQQQIDINWQKESDIFKTKQRQLTDKVAETDKQLKIAADRVRLYGESIENQKALGLAKDKSYQARTEMQQLAHEHTLAEAKMQHEKVMTELEARRANQATETNTTVSYDSAGNITGKKVTKAPLQGHTRMISSDGQEVDVPDDKVQDFIDNYGGKRK